MKENGKKRSSRKKKKMSFLSIWKGFLKWCLAFFYSAWVFVLGILVGRETFPVKFDVEKLQKELTVLKESALNEEQKRFKIDQDSLHEKPPIFDFHTELKSIRVKPKVPPERSEKEKPDTPLSEKTALKVKTALKKIKEKMPEKKASKKIREEIPEKRETALHAYKSENAKSPQKTEKRNISKKEDNAPKNITIQVASFRKSEDADRVMKRMKRRGYPAYMSVAEVPGKGTFYRVRVGYFKNRAEAKGTRNRLRKDDLEPFLTNR